MSGRWVSPYVSAKRVVKEPRSLAFVVVRARARAGRVWVCVELPWGCESESFVFVAPLVSLGGWGTACGN